MKRIKELYELFEKNVNIPKREATLNAISSHPKRDELARLVFERADGNVFVSAKNQLLPANDADEYGPFDHLLEAGHCMRILKMMAKEDYVINLLKDDFRAKHGREPNSLSDIARIFAEREYITKESSLVNRRAVFETNGAAKIGSNWIVTLLGIDGFDDDDTWQESVYVYKILRKEGISLDKVNFHRSSLQLWYFEETFLFEPFLITLDPEEYTFYVFNLLEPSEPPRTIKRGGRPWYILQKDVGGQYRYDSDVRHNGELQGAVLFPLIYVQDDNSFSIECAQISSSSIEYLWKETIIVPEVCFEKKLYLLDHDNLILHIILELNEDQKIANGFLAFHIVLSKRKIIRYDFPQMSGYVQFGIIKERLGITIWNPNDGENSDEVDSDIEFSDAEDRNADDSDGDDSDEDNDKNETGDPGFTTFGWLSEEKNFEIVCFFELAYKQIFGIHGGMIVQDNFLNKTRKKFCTKRLINQLGELKMDQIPELFSTKIINGVAVRRPFVQLERLFPRECSKKRAKKEICVKDRSKIGCVTYQPRKEAFSIEIFI